MNTKEYFDSMASKWDEVTKHDSKKIEAILDLIGIRKCSNIMDVGCGTGVLVSYLNKRVGENGKIVCVDISDKMIEIAKNKYRDCTNVSFINADVNNLNFRNYFDYIICYSVFPHFEDKKNTLLNLTNMLKKGGYLAIAHSQSRKQINQLHKSLPHPVNTHILPNINHLRLLANDKLAVVKSIDDNEKYVVVFKKI